MEPNTQIQVLARARPVRIAFFVSTDEHSHGILDSIFECALSLWGGRFSMVVPCDQGEPVAAYRDWLKAYDPDVIYSYVDMTEGQQLAIHETLYPSHLVNHPVNRDEQNVRFTPDLPFKPLNVSSVLPSAGMPTIFNPARGSRVVSAMGRAESDRLIRDSFGSDFALRNALRSRLAPFGSSLIVIHHNDLQPRAPHVVEAEEIVPDAGTLLRSIAASSRDISLTQLSALACPRMALTDLKWGRAFNLVVSETVADRIMYWNARAFVPAWRDGQTVDMCVPRDRMDDADFISALSVFLQRRNSVDDGNNNGTSRVTMRSLSLTEDQLEPLRAQLQETLRGQVVACEQIGSLDQCVPEARSLEHAGLAMGRSFFTPPLWKETFGTGDTLRLAAPQPEHLRVLPPEAIYPELGAWSVDLDIERSINHSPHDNVRHRWRLPRRLRMAQAFCAHYQITAPHGSFVGPRVSKGGILTVFSVPGMDLPPITVPSDNQAVRTALQRGRDWRPFHRLQDHANLPDQLCYAAERSDAGQHFYGTFQLFGSLRAATSVLLHSFWRQQFEKLGATDQRAVARHDHVLHLLERRLRGRVPNTPEHQTALANAVLHVADEERVTVRSRSWSHLNDDFQSLVTRHVGLNPNAEDTPEALADERASLGMGFRESLQRMCELELFHQGYELRCPKCLHRNWIGVQDLKMKMPCAVCHEVALAPVDQPWQFRLNGFVRDALQRHGIGPLFWVLGRCQQKFREGFWFEGPLNIFLDQAGYDRGTTATDIDLTIVHQDKVIMCEAKQSERGFVRPGQVAENMSRLRPDIALIAVMEPISPRLEAKFQEFSRALDGSGIEPQMWTLEGADDISEDPWFFI